MRAAALAVALPLLAAWALPARAQPSAADLIARFTADSLQAMRAFGRGHPDSARAFVTPLVRDARALGDPRLHGRALLLDAWVLILQNRAPEGLPQVLEARRLLTVARDTSGIMGALQVEARTRLVLGDVAGAAPLVQRWLELADRRGDRHFQAWGHATRGWIEMRIGRDLDLAHRDFVRAEALFDQIPDSAGLAYVVQQRGDLAWSRGDYADARDAYERSIALAERMRAFRVIANSRSNLAMLEAMTGDPARAVEEYRTIAALHRDRGETRDQIVNQHNVAELLLALGRVDEARALIEESIALADRHGIGVDRAQLQRMLGDVHARSNRPEAAKAIWRPLVADGGVDVDTRVVAASGLAQTLADQDSLAAALAVAEAMRSGVAARASARLRADLDLVYADLLDARGDSRGALVLAWAVATTSEARGEEDLALAAWTQTVRAQRRLGRRAEAERSFEHASALWERGRLEIADLEFREQRGEMAHDLMMEGILLALGGSAPDARATALAFARLQRFKTRTMLERMLGPQAFQAGGPAWLGAPDVTLARLQREVLAPDELLLEYACGADTTIVFAITRDAFRAVGLAGADALRSRLELAHELLGRPDRGAAAADAADAALASLGTALLGGLANEITPARRVLVAADGALHDVPFAALAPTGGGGALLDGRRVTMVPSSTILAELRARTPAEARGVVAMAGAGASERARLPGAEREVREIARRYRDVSVWPTRGRDGARAVAERPRDRGILHFAGHARADDQLPWMSYLRMGGSGADSAWRAAAIAGERMSERLVVLSSCASAGGRTRAGEGVAGLASAFLSAGVPAVVATLWPVDDVSTQRFIGRYYEALARGVGAADALMEAQAWMRARPDTRAPFFWAGFVLIGDGAVTPAIEPRRGMSLPIVIAVGITLALALAGFARRRRARLDRPGAPL